MQNNVAKTIQQKRRSKGYTQEQLAQLVGVSSAAVSKWETASALPDVSILCPLARALDCSLDELLDFSPVLTRQQVDTQLEQIEEQFQKGEITGAGDSCKKLVQEYPNDLYLAYRAAQLLERWFGAFSTEEQESQLALMIQLAHRAQQIEQPELHREAVSLLASLYARKKSFDRALELLDELPDCNQEGWAMRAEILRQKGELELACKLDRRTLQEQMQAVQATLQRLVELARCQQSQQMLDGLVQVQQTMNLADKQLTQVLEDTEPSN